MTQASPRAGDGRRAPAGDEAREPGQRRSPVLVPFLTYITLQFYLYYWIWTTSRELERFDPYERSPHATARWGVPLAIVGTLIVGAGVAALLLSDVLVPLEQIAEGQIAVSLAVIGTVLVLGGLVYLAGSLLLWVSYWRMWRGIQTHEGNLGYEPVNPGLMLVLWVGSLFVVGFVPLVGWAIQLGARSYVLYRTQRGLNRVWTGAEGGYAASPPRSPLSPMTPIDPGPEARPSAPRSPQPPPLRAGQTSTPPPSVTRARARSSQAQHRVPFTCGACGNREQIPARRPLRVNCPRCGESELLRDT